MLPSDWVRAARIKGHMTQNVLAAELGVSTVYISYLEHGMRPLNKSIMLKIARVCNAAEYEED